MLRSGRRQGLGSRGGRGQGCASGSGQGWGQVRVMIRGGKGGYHSLGLGVGVRGQSGLVGEV